MKNASIRVVLPVLTFAIFLLSLACGAPENQNTSQNQTGSKPKEDRVITSDSACDEADIKDRRDKVDEKIRREFEDHGRLKDDVKYAVKIVGNTHLEILLEGGVRYKDDIDDLIKIVRKFMKGKCATKVVFVAPGTLPLSSESERYDGFEWIGCEEPNVVCPNGECKRPENCDMASNSNANMPMPTPSP